MIPFGTVKPGTTLYIPFESFAGSTGAPITITGLAVGDIKIWKDGSTTERASTSGFTLLDTDGIDFDAITGIHGFSINLADNTTADFYAAGSQYTVVISTITVDSQTVSFIAATFAIGYPGSILDTFIATLTSQTSFTLNAGPAEDDALNGHYAIIHDQASAVQLAMVPILDYTGSTKTVTLPAGATFTVAAKDNFSVMQKMPLQPATLGRTAAIDASGRVDLGLWLGSAPDALSSGKIPADLKLWLAVAPLALSSQQVQSIVSAYASGQAPLQPTVVGRTVDVSAGGEVGLDWANIGSPTTVQGLSGTTVKTATDVETDTQDIQSRLPAALTAGGNIKADSLALSGDTVAADNAEAFFDGTGYAGTGNTIPTVTSVTNRVTANVDQLGGVAQSLTDLKDFADDGYDPATNKVQGVVLTDTATTVTNRVTANTDQISGDATAADNAEAFFDGTGYAGTNNVIPTVTAVSNDVGITQAGADKVWGTAARTLTAFSFAVDISAAAVSLVWDKLLTGITTVGSIGKLIKDNLDAAISSRLSTAGYTAPPSVGAIADQVWEETLADHLTSGATGAALNAAGSAGDPWGTALPGAYGAGTAGKIIGDNVNTTISSRASQTSVDTVDDFLDTEIAAIKAKTDNLPANPAAVGSAMTLATGAITAGVIATDAFDDDALSADAVAAIQSGLATASALNTVDDFLDTEVAAIKAKTDLIPADPATETTVNTRASQTSLNTLDDFVDTEVAAILAAVDTEIAAIKAQTDLIPPVPAAVGSNMNLSAGAITSAAFGTGAIDANAIAADAGSELATALLDLAAGVETGLTLRQALRLIVAANAGKVSGAASTTITIRNYGDDKDRIVATVTADGDRTALSYDLT